METKKPFTMNLSLINGIPMNSMISQQKVDELANLYLRPGDLFLVSYPKSGSTWMQKIVELVLSNGVDNGLPPFSSFPWPEAEDFLRKLMGEQPLVLEVYRI